MDNITFLNNSFKNKKQVKKELAGKIEAALPELKVRLGEKKFNKRIKKAARLITEGLHLNGTEKKNKKAAAANSSEALLKSEPV